MALSRHSFQHGPGEDAASAERAAGARPQSCEIQVVSEPLARRCLEAAASPRGLFLEHPRELQLVPYPLALDRRVESAVGGVGSAPLWNAFAYHTRQNSAADNSLPRRMKIGGPRLLHDRISRPKLSSRRHAAVVGALPRVSNHPVTKKSGRWSGK